MAASGRRRAQREEGWAELPPGWPDYLAARARGLDHAAAALEGRPLSLIEGPPRGELLPAPVVRIRAPGLPLRRRPRRP